MTVKQGDKVKIEYEGRLDDGNIFDTTQHGEHSHPLEFVLGEGKILPAFEQQIVGMEKGQEKEFKLSSEQAYGEHNPDAKKEFPRNMLPPGQEPKPGMVLMLGTPQGQQMPVKILEVTDDKIVVDFNHPLAGKDLTFKIKLIDIEAK